MILGFKTVKPNGDNTFFESKILSGTKIHTIREGERWIPGKLIHFAVGTRTKEYRCFKQGTCVSTQHIFIYPGSRTVTVDGRMLTDKQQVELAKNDGFDSVDDFYNWFTEPFKGQIIHWTGLIY